MTARLLNVAVIATALLASPAVASSLTPGEAPPPAARPQPVLEARLKNGLQVLVVEDHAAPVATFSIFYRVGSRNEGPGFTGSAHLLEHMQFKGTRRFGKGAIMAGLDRIGARWNATTFYDYTNYYATVPVDRLEYVLDLEADRMQGSLISDAERDLERIVVRNELERSDSSPVSSLIRDVWSVAYLAHPYHHPVIGWRSDVEGVPTSRLRELYRAFYRPDNAVAVLVGDVDAKEGLRLVEKHFGKLKPAGRFPAVYTREPPQRGERRLTVRKPGDMKVLALAYKSPAAADEDTVPLKLLQLVLSGELGLGPFGDPLDAGISNRLYQALVESELATFAAIDYVPMKDPGLFMVLAAPRPEVDHARVEAAVRAEIARLREELVTPQELERARTRAAAAYGLMQDGTSGRAMLLGYFAAIADWRLAADFEDRIGRVRPEDIQRVARTYLRDSQLTVGWFVPEPPSESDQDSGQEARTASPRPHSQLAAFRPFSPGELYAREGLAAATSAKAARTPAQAARAAPREAAGTERPRVHRKVLPNGLTVLVRENRASPTFALSGLIKAGSVHDAPGSPHIAALTAESLMRGTKTRSKLQIATALEEVAASLAFYPGAEEVSISGRGLSRDLERVLDILAEALIDPAFPGEEVEKLKREAVASVRQAEDATSTRARRAFYQALYPKGHPYYLYDPEETIQAIERVQPQSLADFHKRTYGADATVLAVVGDVEADEVIRAVEQRFSAMTRLERRPGRVPLVPVRATPDRTVVYVPDKANVDVILGHQGVIARTDPDYYPAMLANFVFGGSTSARLFQEVRDRQGLTYGISSSLSAGHGAGPWSVWMSLSPQNVDRALPIVERMAAELVAKGVTEQELAAAKETLVGRYKVGLATNGGVANVLATFEGYGLPVDMIDQHPEKIRAVTRADVNRVLGTSFHPGKSVVVIAGSYKARAEEDEDRPTRTSTDAPGPTRTGAD